MFADARRVTGAPCNLALCGIAQEMKPLPNRGLSLVAILCGSSG